MVNTAIATQQNTEVVENVSRNKVTDYSLGIFGTSDNFIMAMQMAKALAESTIVPVQYQKNASNCLIAIEQAQRLRISPLAVMQNLDVIQGRPAWRSKFLIGMINNSGKFDMELQFDEKKDSNGKPFSCTAWTMKGDRRVEGLTIDMEIAQAEGWLTKNGSKWKTMPQLMLRYRAASFFSSLNCPELTLGLYTSEELMDMGNDEYFVSHSMEVINPFENKAIEQKTEENTKVSNPFDKPAEETEGKKKGKKSADEVPSGEQMTIEGAENKEG